MSFKNLFSVVLPLSIALITTSCSNTNGASPAASALAGSTTSSSNQALSISPASDSVPVNSTIQFQASGGSGEYFYSIYQSTSADGTINSETGLYTAPSSAVSVTIQVEDLEIGDMAYASVAVTGGEGSSSLTITPSSDTIDEGQSIQFETTGGSGSYTYSIVSPSSGGGTISSTGLYLAPTDVASDIEVEIEVIDNTYGYTSYAYLTISASAETALDSSPCEGAYSIDANGTRFVLTVVEDSSGNIAGTMSNGNGSSVIEGSCSGGAIAFSREGTNQQYSGTYFPDSNNSSQIDMDGTFTNGSKTYTWVGSSSSVPAQASTVTTFCDGSFSMTTSNADFTLFLVEDGSGNIAGAMSKGSSYWAVSGSCTDAGVITFSRAGTSQVFTGTYSENPSGQVVMDGTYTGKNSWYAISGD